MLIFYSVSFSSVGFKDLAFLNTYGRQISVGLTGNFSMIIFWKEFSVFSMVFQCDWTFQCDFQCHILIVFEPWYSNEMVFKGFHCQIIVRNRTVTKHVNHHVSIWRRWKLQKHCGKLYNLLVASKFSMKSIFWHKHICWVLFFGTSGIFIHCFCRISLLYN